MSFTGREPDFDEVVLEDSSDASTAAPSGKMKIRIKDGQLVLVNDAGEEVSVGGSSEVLSSWIGG